MLEEHLVPGTRVRDPTRDRTHPAAWDGGPGCRKETFPVGIVTMESPGGSRFSLEDCSLGKGWNWRREV